MSCIIKLRKPTAVVLLVFMCSISIIAAKPNWPVFWRQFSTAVKNKDRVALKSLMAPERDFYSGEADNRERWLDDIENRRTGWQELWEAVSSGAKPQRGVSNSRITKDGSLRFSVIAGSWRFVGPMGD